MAQSVEGARPAAASARRPGNGLGGSPGRQPMPGMRWLAVITALAVPIIGLGLLIVSLFGYQYWQDQTLYVSTDNASIRGTLVQVSTPGAGQIKDVAVEVGDPVRRGQVVASMTLSGGAGSALFLVRSPIEGVVVARQGAPGDPVATGRAIVTVADDTSVWVEARIEETKIARLRLGQEADVLVDSLGRSLKGRVAAVGAATAASSPASAQGAGAVPFVKVTQLVPVRIEIDDEGAPLLVGGSVQVKIKV